MEKYQLSAVVMTHPSRINMARALVESEPTGSLRLSVDPDPTGPPSVLRSALAAWASIAPSATHHLVIQDDTTISSDLLDQAQRGIQAKPRAALALFSQWDSRNGGAVRLGALAGARWVSAVNEYTPSPALILPKYVAAGYIKYASSRQGIWTEDILMHRYLHSHCVDTFVAVPNLVEHQDVPSIAESTTFRGPRRSACYGTNSAVGHDESLSLNEISVVPFFKRAVAQCAIRIQGAHPPRWHHVACDTYLENRGADILELREFVAQLSKGLEPSVAWGTWSTAFTLGLLQENSAKPRTWDDSEVVRRALKSIGPGGLCHSSSGDEIQELRDSLSDLARRGLEEGLAFTSINPRASIFTKQLKRPHSYIINVSGPFPSVAPYIIRSLIDRGNQIRLGDTDGINIRQHHLLYERSVAGPINASNRAAHATLDLSGMERCPARSLGSDDWQSNDISRARQNEAVLTTRAGLHGRPTLSFRIGFDELFGPECPGNSTVGRMLLSALAGRAIDINADALLDQIRLLYVDDLVEWICNILVSKSYASTDDGGLPEIVGVPEMAIDVIDLAAAVQRSIRKVQINVSRSSDNGSKNCSVNSESKQQIWDMPSTPAESTLPADHRTPNKTLDYKLHKYAQWLSYEDLP